jgi:hypothetical protein
VVPFERAVRPVEYHATVIGHGILYIELEQRFHRIEKHLKLKANRT